ncbi:DUF1801 domain-containing protein [Candidatus Dojkabacteria bacterium]|nr:DUF1801 domain-containing protein [Candidatus Dojkabacteria bacterium]
MNSKVAEYFKKQPAKHRKILKELRELIISTFPDITEDFMWGVPVYDGGRFYLASLKKQVNLGVSIVDLPEKDVSLFEGSGKTARHIKIYDIPNKDQKKDIVKKLKLVKEKAGIPQ